MSRVINVDQGDYIVKLNSGKTVIDSDFLVNGKPYGTAPVVTNVLYVTMDGTDTNDGSAQDPTRACRTVSGAVKSPLYQPGTTIKVASGHYYENNPIVIKPYTSVIGSDLRTTMLEPINKTQDLFHVNSSCYLAQLQFINGRSGIVDPNLDRGAYTVSFPINYGFSFTGTITDQRSYITGISSTDNIVIGMEIIGIDNAGNFIPTGATVVSIDSGTQITISSNATATISNYKLKTGKITVYKSPYVQNCTNQTGPWLYDGSMFIPNQTVQVPEAIGTTTFTEGLNEITVDVSYGSIVPGMSINTAPQQQGFFSARTLILANVKFIQEQVLEYIAQQYPTFVYDREKCRRDIATIIEHVLFDTTFGGNSKSVQAGVAYWNGVVSYIAGETEQTKSALNYIVTLIASIVNNTQAPNIVSGDNVTLQWINPTLTGGNIALIPFTKNIGIIKKIIDDIANAPTIYYSTGPEFGLDSAEILIQLNKVFIQKEITAYISSKYPSFIYDPDKSERDTGYIVDAISQDILLGGNSRAIEIGTSYYRATELVLQQLELTICTDAFTRISDVLQSIVKSDTVIKTTGNNQTQIKVVANTETENLTNGIITVPTIVRNMQIISNIVNNGVEVAPIKYSGTALFSATGVSADNVQQSTKVVSVSLQTGTQYSVVLDKPTVGIGNFSTLYFGFTTVYPLIDANIPDVWANRRCDPWGAMGGMLIDGDVVTDNSPVRSFVADAFTQVNQGGRGVRVTNRGYVQLVSVFTIFSSIAVQADNGGIASITNSNANFGTYCMISKGYGPREFSGTVYNPSASSFNDISKSFEYNINYQSGFFPYKQRVCVFVPDTANRPHIALMMEVEPPITYVNAQGKSGFLTATITFPTITAGSLFLSGIEVDNMYIGQTVYVRDQYGSYGVTNPVTNEFTPYLQDGTIISDLGPETIYFNKPVKLSGGDVNNPSYFTLFTCGKAYYTILSSEPSNNPSLRSDKTSINASDSILPTAQITTNTGLDSDNPEVASLQYLSTLLLNVISNTPTEVNQTYVEQVLDTAYDGTASANRVETLINIVIDTLKNGYESAPTPVKVGQVVPSDGDAAQLILKNLQFFVEEITAFIKSQVALAIPESNWYRLIYNSTKCRRDVALICTNLAYDLVAGGNYNAVYSALSYFSRPGTYHIVTLEDSVTDYNLFPDGAIVNFYQRSYMSASGYLFEYVGAGTNYGALPQVGRVDPKQPNEVNMLDGGKVFFTSTDQNGDFRIGPGLVISQATGVLSGRTFQKSLFAEITPFILAIEG
jgi:hypothetical protein